MDISWKTKLNGSGLNTDNGQFHTPNVRARAQILCYLPLLIYLDLTNAKYLFTPSSY